jgi:small-conductance mechanosensitive channel
LQQKVSALIGIIGGIIDLVAGGAILQNAPMYGAGAMMGQQPTMMTSTVLVAYFLLGLGVVVLFTGLYMLSMRMMRHQPTLGALMILYGVIMLALGVGMVSQMLAVMLTQMSTFSGAVMIVVGVLMLYSGVAMARK